MGLKVTIAIILSSILRTTGSFQEPKTEVILFLGLECPISQKYIYRINELVELYGQQVAWQAYVPEKRKESEMNEFRNDYKPKFPMAMDTGLKYTRKFNAKITPEVIVLKQGKLEYQGAIDNWYYELGRHRNEPTEFYLRDALDNLLKGAEVRIRRTDAVGCFIQLPVSAGHDHH